MSSQQLVFNNLGSTLVSGITSGQTSFSVVDPVFPSPSPDFYHVTVENVSSGAIEIMKVIGVSGATLTVERGADGTSPSSFDAGNSVQLRTTAGLLNRLGQKSDLGEAYPFQTTVVTGILNLYVDTAGSDVTGDGSLGNPWATPYKVLEELQFIRFGITGSAVVNFAAGTYAMDAKLLFNHPQGYRIFFTSSAAFQPITGVPIGDYTGNRNSPVVPGRGAAEFYNTCGTVGVSTNSTTRATNRANDWANNRTLIKSLCACQFEWLSAGADEEKFRVVTSLGGFSNIALLFPTPTPGVPDSRAGIWVSEGGVMEADDLVIYGGQDAVLLIGGSLRCNTLAVTGNRGVLVKNNGVLRTETLIMQGADGAGMILQSNAVLDTDGESFFTGSSSHGAIIADNSTWRSVNHKITASGNEGDGVGFYDQTSFASNLGAGTPHVFSGNVNHGLKIDGGNYNSNSVDAIGNGNRGIEAENNGVFRTIGGTTICRNNGDDGLILRVGAVAELNVYQGLDNDGMGLRVAIGSSVSAVTATLTGNQEHAFLGTYANGCRFAGLTVDTSNALTPHMLALGGTVVECPGPGVGGVAGDVVFDPPYNTMGNAGEIFVPN